MGDKVYYRAFAVFAVPETFAAIEAVGLAFWKDTAAWLTWNPVELEEAARAQLNARPNGKLIRMFVERIDEALFDKIAARHAQNKYAKIGEGDCIVISDDF